MSQVLSVRFIPNWLKGVIEHHGGDYKEFDSIVSTYDLKFYKLANYLLMATLSGYQLKDSIAFPDASVEGFQYTQEDARFSLYGNTRLDANIADFNLSQFKIVPSTDPAYDVYLVDDAGNSEPSRCLIAELTKAAGMYSGKANLYESDLFTAYLKTQHDVLQAAA